VESAVRERKKGMKNGGKKPVKKPYWPIRLYSSEKKPGSKEKGVHKKAWKRGERRRWRESKVPPARDFPPPKGDGR